MSYNEGVDIGLTTMGFFSDAVNSSAEITALHHAKGLQKIAAQEAKMIFLPSLVLPEKQHTTRLCCVLRDGFESWIHQQTCAD